VLGGDVSRSGDLGYTYGSYRTSGAAGAPVAGYYLRIWRWQPESGWKVVLDQLTPNPPPRPAPSG
jgi:ketosteroid isomerase-like protein